jgi:hypothetical protein
MKFQILKLVDTFSHHHSHQAERPFFTQRRCDFIVCSSELGLLRSKESIRYLQNTYAIYSSSSWGPSKGGKRDVRIPEGSGKARYYLWSSLQNAVCLVHCLRLMHRFNKNETATLVTYSFFHASAFCLLSTSDTCYGCSGIICTHNNKTCDRCA